MKPGREHRHLDEVLALLRPIDPHPHVSTCKVFLIVWRNGTRDDIFHMPIQAKHPERAVARARAHIMAKLGPAASVLA